jgi:hypothetical protein
MQSKINLSLSLPPPALQIRVKFPTGIYRCLSLFIIMSTPVFGGPNADSTTGHEYSHPLCLQDHVCDVKPAVRVKSGYPETKPRVRMLYIIPADRTVRESSLEKLHDWLCMAHDFFLDQMLINGFGPLTFRFETEPGTTTLKIHILEVDRHAEWFRSDSAGRISRAARRHGYHLEAPGEIWAVVCEMHDMNEDGSIEGHHHSGINHIIVNGNANSGGMGMTGSSILPLLGDSLMQNSSPYDGRVIPELGQYPMVYGVTARKYEGRTINEISSSMTGAWLHELGHAFGLFWHDFRSDRNFHGNLMGNGFRGLRGHLFPSRFRDNTTRLGWSQAKILSNSPYFREKNPSR